ncbi:VOC family protein [Ectopseudomonas mendocina]|uniref:VOC family protein n=1 Tax=Ectopseudomonas mendocina TaxID=300 RepID=A0ABZ2RHF9_ECTME
MALPQGRFRHIGVPAFDPDALGQFYSRWFGFVVSDTGNGRGDGARVVFMTGDPEEHHQIAFANLRREGHPGMQQISFVYDTLEDLKKMAVEFHKAGVPILQQKDHGNTWSIYVSDPEGNRIECYTPSPWYVTQPTWWDIDLVNESIEEIYARTEAKAKESPGFCSREEWQERIRAGVKANLEAFES